MTMGSISVTWHHPHRREHVHDINGLLFKEPCLPSVKIVSVQDDNGHRAGEKAEKNGTTTGEGQ